MNNTQTAGERLAEARFIKRIQRDRYAGQRAREEAHYTRLVRIGRGPGPLKHTNYAATGGSGYNAKKRASILLHAFDSRRLKAGFGYRHEVVDQHVHVRVGE